MPHTIIKVSNREHATILAALRHWQRVPGEALMHEDDIATNGGELEALSPPEIDELCERINGDTAHLGSVAIDVDGGLVGDFFTDDPELIGRLDLVVIDYDVDGADPAECIGVRDGVGESDLAGVSVRTLERSIVGLREIDQQLDAIADDEKETTRCRG